MSGLIIFLVMRVRFGRYKVTKIDTTFNITIGKIKTYRGYLYVNDSLQIGSLFMKKDSVKLSLDDFVQMGDRIIKNKGSYSISLIRRDSIYIFNRFVDDRNMSYQ